MFRSALFLILLSALLVSFGARAAAGSSVPEKRVRQLLQQPASRTDYLTLKLAVDGIVDPTMDAEATRARFESMVAAIKKMLPSPASSREKLQAIRLYLYEKGSWNQAQTFLYDFEDGEGKRLQTKVLANYFATKKGNCVSMPILMLLLADRLGLDVALAYAPMHYLIKFTETETGRTYNVEATSGGGFARDEWYREKMGITDAAIRNGIYLRKLSRQETAYAIADLLGEYHLRSEAYDKAIDHFQFVLQRSPKHIYAMLKIGNAYASLLRRKFYSAYQRIEDVPARDRPQLKFYTMENKKYFAMAETLGWRDDTIAPPR